jgi:hypothetical protein
MKPQNVPYSNLFFIGAAMMLFHVFYARFTGDRYAGNALFSYTDSLKEAPTFYSPGKSPDYYLFQLSYSRSKFVITGPACDFIRNDNNRRNAIEALDVGRVVTVQYQNVDEGLSNSNINKVNAVGLSIDDNVILSPNQVIEVNKKDDRMYFYIASGLFISGLISLYLRKRKR